MMSVLWRSEGRETNVSDVGGKINASDVTECITSSSLVTPVATFTATTLKAALLNAHICIRFYLEIAHVTMQLMMGIFKALRYFLSKWRCGSRKNQISDWNYDVSVDDGTIIHLVSCEMAAANMYRVSGHATCPDLDIHCYTSATSYSTDDTTTVHVLPGDAETATGVCGAIRRLRQRHAVLCSGELVD